MTDPSLLRAYLRQLVELGAPDLFPERLDRAALEAILKRRTTETAAGCEAEPGPTSPGTSQPPPARSAPTGADPKASAGAARGAGASRRVLPSAPGRPAATAAAAFSGDEAYEALRAEALACTRCGLAATRKQVVFSDGNPSARLAVVGEAPGAREDDTGLPFVGPAGKLLDLMLATVGLSRADTAYICNILKCRPPGNRNPLPDEIETCTPYLKRQIQSVQPEVILAVGSFAAQYLTGKAMALGKLRGQIYTFQGTPVVVTYHPAALLRNGGWTRPTWDDLQLLRQVMDSNA